MPFGRPCDPGVGRKGVRHAAESTTEPKTVAARRGT
ncbi:putative aldehyde dehydrogenase [Actinobacteria bacterium OK074]|nr:putative aldehyde dehydrogenase [Actinobacteria bacterium OK074]